MCHVIRRIELKGNQALETEYALLNTGSAPTRTDYALSPPFEGCIDLFVSGWPKKVSHYHESSLNRIKNPPLRLHCHHFDYKMSTRIR